MRRRSRPPRHRVQVLPPSADRYSAGGRRPNVWSTATSTRESLGSDATHLTSGWSGNSGVNVPPKSSLRVTPEGTTTDPSTRRSSGVGGNRPMGRYVAPRSSLRNTPGAGLPEAALAKRTASPSNAIALTTGLPTSQRQSETQVAPASSDRYSPSWYAYQVLPSGATKGAPGAFATCVQIAPASLDRKTPAAVSLNIAPGAASNVTCSVHPGS